jgi:hypothetical protein
MFLGRIVQRGEAAKQVFHETFQIAKEKKIVVCTLLESCFPLNTSRPSKENFSSSEHRPKDL